MSGIKFMVTLRIDNFITLIVPPIEGSIKLMNSTENPNNETSGVVLIAHEGVWGGFCNAGFNAATGKVLCRQLGYTDYSSHTCCFRSISMSRKIWVTNSQCNSQDKVIGISRCNVTYGVNADLCYGNVRLTCRSKFTHYLLPLNS